jgi:hypothetical protein
LDLLFEMPHPGDRILYLTSPDSPDFSLRREICRLDAAYSLVTTETFRGVGEIEVWAYRVR